jgi:hypothetical protein
VRALSACPPRPLFLACGLRTADCAWQ